MKRFLFFLIILLFVAQAGLYSVRAEGESKVTAVYFYSPTCASCRSMSEFLEGIGGRYKYFNLRKYDISDLRNKSLLDKYSDAYRVSAEDEGIVPVVFIGNRYYTDEVSIRNNIENIFSSSGVKTLDINSSIENHQKDLNRFEGFKLASVFLAGLVNGINPCSISMLLFFLSLLAVKKVKILKTGLSFIAGKFLAYILLGTILFRFLSYLNFSFLNVLMKFMLAVVLLILIIMSIQDYFAAKAERYDRILLQLPEVLRKINQDRKSVV
jgi:thiol-disulfide isomerase/thioredoxin